MENRMSDKLIDAINEIANLSNEDKVQIKGKFYTTVDKRLQVLRKHLGSKVGVITNIIHHDLERVVVEAQIEICNAEETGWYTIGKDFAEEFRAEGYINKTSALENCCTSAIGRALASCGLGGGEYASAFEVDNAINSKPSAPKKIVKRTEPNKVKGFLLKRIDDDEISMDTTPVDYIQSIRVQMALLNDEKRKELFTLNSSEIERAYLSIETKDVSLKQSYDTMVEMYA